MMFGVGAKHTCEPPKGDPARDEPPEWACPECGALWRTRVVAEGYRFERGGSREPFTKTEWQRVKDATD